MRKVLVTFVLALTTGALGQGTTQPPAQQPADQANTPTQSKVIKDPAEYNAYMTALNMTDPAAQAQAMENFVKQYPNSIVKLEALEYARSAYQKLKNDPKVEEMAQKTLEADPKNVPALAVVVYMERGRIKDSASGAKARADAERGLQELQTFKKPEGVSDAEFEKIRSSALSIFAGTAAFGALQQQDYPAAQKYYAQVLKTDPNDMATNYQMGIAMLQPTPMNLEGFWYGAKAIALAQAQSNQAAVNQMAPYFTTRYKKYHGGTDGWDQLVASTAQATAPPAGFTIKAAPTVCELAAAAVPTDGSQIDLSFSDRETVLSCRDKSPANKAAADAVWQDLQKLQKNGEAKLKVPVKVIAVPDSNTLEVAVSDDNQKDGKTDMKVQMEKPMTKQPAVGATTDVIGVISEYTPDPFMFTMTKGELPGAPKPPAKKPTPTHKTGATTKKK